MSWLSEAIGMVFDPGKSSRDDAQRLNEQSLQSQQGQEAWRRGLMEDRLNLGNQMLFGGNVQDPNAIGPDGVNSAPGVDVQGALPQAEDWNARFMTFLDKAPDTTYNQQRSTFERSMKDAEASLNTQLNRRGLLDSALGASKFGDVSMNRARGLSALEGERMDRKGQSIATGAQFSNSLLDRALSMGDRASGMAAGFQSNVPNMMSSQANQATKPANAADGGIGSQLVAQGAQSVFDRMFPQKATNYSNGSQNAGGVGQSLIKDATKAYFSPMGLT